MTKEEAIKWLGNLIDDIGQTRGMYLWPYAQALQEIISMLEDCKAGQTAKWEEPVAEGIWSWAKPAYAQCSNCKKKSYLGWKDPYCRYCGAKMLPEPPKEGEHGA